MSNQQPQTPHMRDRARSLRKSQTPAEALFWAAVRNRGFANLKFRRQHAIGPYVADFFCDEKKLVIELDGESQDFTTEADVKRTEYLNSLGLTVMRFLNEDVLDDLEAVLKAIAQRLDIAWPETEEPSPCCPADSFPLPGGEGTKCS